MIDLAQLGPAPRLPIPICYDDPAFMKCLDGAIETPELMQQFDRLFGATIVSRKSAIETIVDKATGKHDDDCRAFVAFVHDAIYTRLPDAAIHAFRLAEQVPQA